MYYQIQYKRGNDKPELIATKEVENATLSTSHELCLWIAATMTKHPLDGASLIVVPSTPPSYDQTKVKIKE